MNSFSKSDWLTLVRGDRLGSRTLIPLLQTSSNMAEMLAQATPSQQTLIRRAFDRVNQEFLDYDLNWLEHTDHHLITYHDARYPSLLKEISDPPIALFAYGDPSLMSMAQLAIVGSRNPTQQGKENAFNFSRYLASSGLSINSGMAAGIDTGAHQGALAAQGNTIAVIGTGPDRIYPASNNKLAREIAEKGLIISEFPPGTPPSAGNFPKRNRIISGLSVGTLVVEAALRSGSLITAHQAMEQGREVFAIPGSIHNPQSRGCHKLIREGVRLVETGEDIVSDLGSLFATLTVDTPTHSAEIAAEPSSTMDDEYLQLLEHMGWDPVTADELIHRSGFSAESVSSMLLLLELQGHVSSASGGRFLRCHPSS